MNKKTRIMLERLLAKKASSKKAITFFKRNIKDTELDLKREIAELKKQIGQSSNLTLDLRNRLEEKLVETKKEIVRLQESLKFSEKQFISDPEQYREVKNETDAIKQTVENLQALEIDIKKQLAPFEALDRMQGESASAISQLKQKQNLLKVIPKDQTKLIADTKKEIKELEEQVASLKKSLLPAELIEAERELKRYQGLPPSDMITVFATHLLLGAFGSTLNVRVEKENKQGVKEKKYVRIDELEDEDIPDDAEYQFVEENKTVDQVFVYRGLNLEAYTEKVNEYILYFLQNDISTEDSLFKQFKSYVGNDAIILDLITNMININLETKSEKQKNTKIKNRKIFTSKDLSLVHQAKFKTNKFYNIPFAIDRQKYEDNKDLYTLVYEPELDDKKFVVLDDDGRYVPKKNAEGKITPVQKKKTVKTGTTNFKSVLHQAKKYSKLDFQRVLEAFYQETEAWAAESKIRKREYDRGIAESEKAKSDEIARIEKEKQERASEVTDLSKNFFKENSSDFNKFKNTGLAGTEKEIAKEKAKLLKEYGDKKYTFKGQEYSYEQLQNLALSSRPKNLPKNITPEEKQELLSWAYAQVSNIDSMLNQEIYPKKKRLLEDYEFSNFGKVGLSCKGGDIKIDFRSKFLVETPTIKKALKEFRTLATKTTYKTQRMEKPFLELDLNLEEMLTKQLKENQVHQVRPLSSIKEDLLKALSKGGEIDGQIQVYPDTQKWYDYSSEEGYEDEEGANAINTSIVEPKAVNFEIRKSYIESAINDLNLNTEITSYKKNPSKVTPYETRMEFYSLVKDKVKEKIKEEFDGRGIGSFSPFEEKVMRYYDTVLNDIFTRVSTVDSKNKYNEKDIPKILLEKLTSYDPEVRRSIDDTIEYLVNNPSTTYNVLLKDLQAFYMLNKENGTYYNRLFSVSTYSEYIDLTDRLLSEKNAEKDPGVLKVIKRIVRKAYVGEVAIQTKELIEKLSKNLKVKDIVVEKLVGTDLVKENESPYKDKLKSLAEEARNNEDERNIIFRTNEMLKELVKSRPILGKKDVSEFENLQEVFTFVLNTPVSEEEAYKRYLKEIYTMYVNEGRVIADKFNPDLMILDQLNNEIKKKFEALKGTSKKASNNYTFIDQALKIVINKYLQMSEYFFTHLGIEGISVPPDNRTMDLLNKSEEDIYKYKEQIIEFKLKGAEYAGFETAIAMEQKKIDKIKSQFKPLHIIEDSITSPRTKTGAISKISPWAEVGFNISDKLKNIEVASDFESFVNIVKSGMLQVLNNFNSTAFSIFYRINHGDKDVGDDLVAKELLDKLSSDHTTMTQVLKYNFTTNNITEALKKLSLSRKNDRGQNVVTNPFDENIGNPGVQELINSINTEIQSGKNSLELNTKIINLLSKKVPVSEEDPGQTKSLMQILGYEKIVDGRPVLTQKPAQLASNILKNVVFNSIGVNKAKSMVNSRFYTVNVEVENEEGEVFNRSDLGVEDAYREERLNENNIKKDIKTVGLKLGENSHLLPDIINLFGNASIFNTPIAGLETKAENFFLKQKVKDLSKLKFVRNMKDIVMALTSPGINVFWNGKNFKTGVEDGTFSYDFSKYSLDDYFEMFNQLGEISKEQKIKDFLNEWTLFNTSVNAVYQECKDLMENSYSINPKLVNSSPQQKLVFDLLEYFTSTGELQFHVDLTAGDLNSLLVKKYDLIKESLLKENSKNILNEQRVKEVTATEIKELFDFFKKVLVKPSLQEKVPVALLKKIKDANTATEKFNIFVNEISKIKVDMFASRTFKKRELEAVKDKIGVAQYIDLALNVLKDTSIERDLANSDTATLEKARNKAKEDLLDSINKEIGVDYDPETMFNEDLSFNIPANIALVIYTLVAKSYCLVVLLDSVPKIDEKGDKIGGNIEFKLKKFLQENPSWWGIFNRTGKADFDITSQINQAYFSFFKGLERYLDKSDEIYQDAKKVFKSPASKFNFAYENPEETAEEKLQSKKNTLSQFVVDFMDKERVQGVSGVQILKALEDLSGGDLNKLIKEKIKLQELGSETIDPQYVLFDSTNRVLTARGVKFADALLANKASLENYETITKQKQIIDLQKQLKQYKDRLKSVSQTLAKSSVDIDITKPNNEMRILAVAIDALKAGLIRLDYKVSQTKDGIVVQPKKSANKTKKQRKLNQGVKVNLVFKTPSDPATDGTSYSTDIDPASISGNITEESQFQFLYSLLENTKNVLTERGITDETILKTVLPSFDVEIKDTDSFKVLISDLFSKILNSLRMGYINASNARMKEIERNVEAVFRQSYGRKISTLQAEIDKDLQQLETLSFDFDIDSTNAFIQLSNQIEKKKEQIKAFKKEVAEEIKNNKAGKTTEEKKELEKQGLIVNLSAEYNELKTNISLTESEINSLVLYVHSRFGDLQQEILNAYDQSIKIFYNLAKELEKNITHLDEPLKSILSKFLVYLTTLGK
jgi:hypothetical protein